MALKKNTCFISKFQKFSNIKSFNFSLSFPCGCMVCQGNEGRCGHTVADFEETCDHAIAGLKEGCRRFVPQTLLIDLEPWTVWGSLHCSQLHNSKNRYLILQYNKNFGWRFSFFFRILSHGSTCNLFYWDWNQLPTRSNEKNAQWPLWELISLIRPYHRSCAAITRCRCYTG